MGKGLTGSCSLQRNPSPDMKTGIAGPTSLQEIAESITGARLSEEEGSGNSPRRDPCGGRAGNCPPYREAELYAE
jgi:hypothetical protein